MADVAWTVSGYHSDVVIWAAGGVAVNIPEFWAFSRNNPDRPMLIVDFLDDFTTVTRKWSVQRRDDLAQRDIFRVGTPAVIGRIERFDSLIRDRR